MPLPDQAPLPDDPERLRTFEVVVPHGRYADFAAWVTAQGLGWHEVISEPEEGTPLTDEHLAAASTELFGDPVYGTSMASVLATRRQDSAGWAALWEPSEVSLHPSRVGNGSFWRKAIVSYRGAPDIPSLEHFVRARLARAKLPFPLTITPTHRESGEVGAGPMVDIVPGPITLERLAEYTEAAGYHQHNMHGAIGKGLSAVARAAGHDAVPTALDIDQPFLASGELEDAFRSRLPRSTAELLLDHIRRALLTQLFTGKPTDHGEVVIEGGFSLERADIGHAITYDRIGRGSLAVIARRYGRKSQTPATDLLYELAAG